MHSRCVHIMMVRYVQGPNRVDAERWLLDLRREPASTYLYISVLGMYLYSPVYIQRPVTSRNLCSRQQ